MSILQPDLLTWNQFGEPTPDHNESCGQNATASTLIGGGHLPPDGSAPLTVDQWMRDQRDSAGRLRYPGLATQGTQTNWLQDVLEHFGGTRGHDHGNNWDAIIQTINAGKYAIVLVGSDHLGHPVPNNRAVTGHWVACYGFDGQFYHVANSGSGKTEVYPNDYFRSAYRGITLDTGIAPRDLQGEDLMTPEEKKQTAFALSLLVRNQYLMRTSRVEEVQGTAADMVARGFEAGMWAIVGSDEAKAAAAKRGF